MAWRMWGRSIRGRENNFARKARRNSVEILWFLGDFEWKLNFYLRVFKWGEVFGG